jgi:hypothetical protein
VFYVPPTNWQGEEAFVVDHIHEWDDHWKVVNASYEKGPRPPPHCNDRHEQDSN